MTVWLANIVGVFVIDAIFQEGLNVGEGEVTRDEHAWHNDHRVRHLRVELVYCFVLDVKDGLQEVQALLGAEDLHVEIYVLGDCATLLNSLLYFLSIFGLLNELVAKLEHFEEVFLSTLENRGPSMDRFLLQCKVLGHGELFVFEGF